MGHNILYTVQRYIINRFFVWAAGHGSDIWDRIPGSVINWL